MKKYFLLLLVTVFLASCSDEDPQVYKGDSLTYFTNGVAGKYYIQEAEDPYQIQVGVTDVSSVDRTFSIEIDDASTATTAEYSIGSSLVIPANSHIGTIDVYGDYNNVVNGSTLIIKLIDVEGSNVATFDNVFTLTLYQYCEFVRDDFLGTWNADEEGYQVYTSVFTAGEGDNEIIMSNLWDVNPSSQTLVIFNDSNPSNFVLEFPPYEENYLYDHPNYGPAYIDAGYGTFDACNQVIDMYFTVRVSEGTFEETHIVFTRP